MSDTMDFAMLLLYCKIKEKKRKARQRKWWVRPWIQRRMEHGAYHALMQEMAAEDGGSYRNFVRMDRHHFELMLTRITPHIKRQDSNMRECISPGERLAVTLRFLATGDSYHSLSFLYRLGRTTVGKIIPETCKAITAALKDQYLKVPNTAEEWQAIAVAFEEKWNFPNCIGAIDGKHVALKAPPKSGSTFYNYKDFYSIVLLAVVDALYRFVWYDIGANGRNNDAGIFSCSSLAKALESNSVNIPAERNLPNTNISLPYMLVGDEAFPLKKYLIKPYPQRGLKEPEKVFNYRLSRARRVSENAFGILVHRLRVLSHAISLQPEVASCVVECCVALHNFLRSEKDVAYTQDIRQRGVRWCRDSPEERQSFFTSNNSSVFARQMRDKLCDYFCGPGQVPWQWDQI